VLTSSPALAQDYMRCLQTPLCCESKMLPDLETLQDRMSLLAYDSGLNGGADGRVAALGVQAVEVSPIPSLTDNTH
jgi:transcriptional coactivator HFI1/ADA1